MALSPLLLAERRRRGICKKVESVPDRPLALCRGSGAALANPAPAEPLTASTYQPENLGPDRTPGLRPARMRDDQTSRSITRGIKTSEEWFDSSDVLMPRAMLRLVWLFPSCELAVARVHGRVPSSRAGMLTLPTVWPEPGLREQPLSLRTEREDGQGRTRLFYIRPCVTFPQGGGGKAPCCPRRAPNMVSPVSC